MVAVRTLAVTTSRSKGNPGQAPAHKALSGEIDTGHSLCLFSSYGDMQGFLCWFTTFLHTPGTGYPPPGALTSSTRRGWRRQRDGVHCEVGHYCFGLRGTLCLQFGNSGLNTLTVPGTALNWP